VTDLKQKKLTFLVVIFHQKNSNLNLMGIIFTTQKLVENQCLLTKKN